LGKEERVVEKGGEEGWEGLGLLQSLPFEVFHGSCSKKEKALALKGRAVGIKGFR